jgi:beta-RFAP synthase
MLSFGWPGTRQFGGAGAMIDAPGVRLSISTAGRFGVEGPFAGRVVEFVEQMRQAGWLPRELLCRIAVESAPRPHVGLGSGTQLAMAVAIGLNAFFNGPGRTAADFARALGRGRRSAIGVYGALAGGLLVEAGKLADDELSPLVSRIELPPQWRFVLLIPREQQGLSGLDEHRAFDRLPPVPAETTAELSRLLVLELLPATIEHDFDRFGDSLHRFGRMAGECFAAQQGGAFAGPHSLELIERLRDLGARGVGQTSWGPTVFALTRDAAEAEQLIARMNPSASAIDIECAIAAPSPIGMRTIVSDA